MEELTMDKMTAKHLNEDIARAIENVFAVYGIEKTKCNLTWTDATFEWKIVGRKVDEDGSRVVDPREEAKAKWFLTRNGIKAPEQVLGTKVRVANLGMCEIIGFNSRSPKYAFTVKTDTGRQYRTTAGSLMF